MENGRMSEWELAQIMSAIEAVKTEAQQNCDRISVLESNRGKVPPWIWSLIVSSLIFGFGAVWVQGQFRGQFDEFKSYVSQRIDTLEKRQWDDSRGIGERPR